MPEAIILPVLFVSFFAAVAYWLHVRDRRGRDRLQAQVDLQTKILARFDSPQDFAGFLQTDGGQRFLTGLTERPGWRPVQRILTAVQIGIVLATFGLGLCVIGWIQQDQDPALFGIVLLSVGVGFLIAAAVSHRLSKGWGLLDAQPTAGRELFGELGS